MYGLVLGSLNDKDVDKTQEWAASQLFLKLNANRKALNDLGVSALAYIQRLTDGNSDSETASAIQKILSLRVKDNTSASVHNCIMTFKDLSTKLGADLSGKRALSALRTGLMLQGTDQA